MAMRRSTVATRLGTGIAIELAVPLAASSSAVIAPPWSTPVSGLPTRCSAHGSAQAERGVQRDDAARQHLVDQRDVDNGWSLGHDAGLSRKLGAPHLPREAS